VETLGHSSHHLGSLDNYSLGVFKGDAVGICTPQLDVTFRVAPAPLRLDVTSASEKLTKLQPE
jgi:hypothetical protein